MTWIQRIRYWIAYAIIKLGRSQGLETVITEHSDRSLTIAIQNRKGDLTWKKNG